MEKAAHIVVIDAQGGGIGKQLVAAIKKSIPDTVVTAVGTNGAATSAMIKAGADHAATGENAVVVACRRTDFIMGPIGIVIADAMLGEITPAMAVAVGQSSAVRILIPVERCATTVAGVQDTSTGILIKSAVDSLRSLIGRSSN